MESDAVSSDRSVRWASQNSMIMSQDKTFAVSRLQSANGLLPR